MSNYTETMIAKIQAAAPLNLDKAHKLAGELGVSYRSVISKAKQLGVEYVKQERAAKSPKDTGPTKVQMLAEIRSKLALADREGDLTKDELAAILAAVA